MLASKFGFMIESCIMAVRSSEDMICPAHKTHPLPVRDIAPDVVRKELNQLYVQCLSFDFVAPSILHLRLPYDMQTHVHVELESACLSELNEDRLCIALLDRLLCVV